MKLYSDIKLWAPVNYNSSNADLAQYRGVWELNMTVTRFVGGPLDYDDLSFRLYPGGPSFTDPLHGGQELTLRINGTHRTFLPLFVFQIFHGYGEDLRRLQPRALGRARGYRLLRKIVSEARMSFHELNLVIRRYSPQNSVAVRESAKALDQLFMKLFETIIIF